VIQQNKDRNPSRLAWSQSAQACRGAVAQQNKDETSSPRRPTTASALVVASVLFADTVRPFLCAELRSFPRQY
jgi:hypothetical protein